MQAAKGRGQHLSRPVVLEGEEFARLHRLHAAGHSQRAIASLLGISQTTVARAIAQLRAEAA